MGSKNSRKTGEARRNFCKRRKLMNRGFRANFRDDLLKNRKNDPSPVPHLYSIHHIWIPLKGRSVSIHPRVPVSKLRSPAMRPGGPPVKPSNPSFKTPRPGGPPAKSSKPSFPAPKSSSQSLKPSPKPRSPAKRTPRPRPRPPN